MNGDRLDAAPRDSGIIERVPWSPDWEVSDSRLDPYRNRVAELRRAGTRAGHLLVLGEVWSTPIGGHLWWRRWVTHELPMLYLEFADGTSFDTPVREEDIDDELEAWSQGLFPLFGEHLEITWLSQDEAIAMAPEMFGVTWCLDNNDHVIWSWPPK